MKITILGTGTSQGVPVIGCDCEVCLSNDPRDKRLRVSILLETQDLTLVVDCGPDFRYQMLRADVKKLDAILITHQHNDHIIGLDDVRPFNFSTWSDMPVYATPSVIREFKIRFAYIFDADPYPGAPMIKLTPIDPGQTFAIKSLDIQPIQVLHGQLPVLGFRFGSFAYITDMKTISELELNKVKGVRILVINALHHKFHHSHLNLEEALAMIDRIKPKQAFLTHLSHRMGLYTEVEKTLPPGVHLAYDGLELLV